MLCYFNLKRIKEFVLKMYKFTAKTCFIFAILHIFFTVEYSAKAEFVYLYQYNDLYIYVNFGKHGLLTLKANQYLKKYFFTLSTKTLLVFIIILFFCAKFIRIYFCWIIILPKIFTLFSFGTIPKLNYTDV